MWKLAAIYSGGDWADASCDHLVIPENMNLDEEKRAWDIWYSTYKYGRDKYVSFIDFLKTHGARDIREGECIEFWDY